MIVDAVRDWLDGDDWKYEYSAENNVIRATININSKVKSCRITIIFHEDAYTVYLTAPFNGDVDNPNELMKYLTMANFGPRNGNFELDLSDGEIRYKTYVNCENLESLPQEIIQESVYVGCAMMDRYGNGIAALAFGFSDAETEIKKAEPDLDEEE